MSVPLRQDFPGGLRGWSGVQALALVAAVALAYNGARILHDSPTTAVPTLRNFDSAMPWLGAALLAVLIAAWRPAVSPPKAWWPQVVAFARAHRVEIALFLLIFAFGVFMRVFRFGGSLPPSNGICCEEDINGGVAYLALHGDRPLLFPLGRWASAGGFLLFGENTLGLRFFFPVMGIATIVILYLLIRQLASAPAALFGTALYAAAWWPALRSRQATEGTIYTVLFALLLVRGMRTKSPLMFFLAGIVAGLVSYEYEPFRAVPLFGAGFVAAAALRGVLLRSPRTIAAVRERARTLALVWWRPVAVFVFAAGIVATPLIVGEAKGYDLYLTSVHRQEDSRGGPLLEESWRTQLKFVAEVFIPGGPNEYTTSTPRDVDGVELLDPLTATLILAGLAAGAVFVLRGYRLLFVGWMLVSCVAAALVLESFAPWKVIGLVPVGLVLAALLVDDVRRVVIARAGRAGERALYGVMALALAFVFWWNADTLFNDVAPSFAIQSGYGLTKGAVYATCDYLQDRGHDNYTYAASTLKPLQGFAYPRATLRAEARAWGDFVWACHGLEGVALPAPEEAWPLRDLPAGRVTFVFTDPHTPIERIVAELNQAYPGLGAPGRVESGPADTYRIISYEFEGAEALAMEGLWGEYEVLRPIAQEEPLTGRIDHVESLDWSASPPVVGAPFRVTWRGVIYVEEAGTRSLRLDGSSLTTIRVDGRVLSGIGPTDATVQTFVEVEQGWHPIEITLASGPAPLRRLALNWVDETGESTAVVQQDLFPLRELSGWVHERALGLADDPRQMVTTRLDFSPHYGSADAVRIAAQEGVSGPFLTEERWRGVWDVADPGSYVFAVEFEYGTMTLLIDGQQVAEENANGRAVELRAELPLDAGPHTIELLQRFKLEVPVSGGTLSVGRAGAPGAQPEPVALDVRPY